MSRWLLSLVFLLVGIGLGTPALTPVAAEPPVPSEAAAEQRGEMSARVAARQARRDARRAARRQRKAQKELKEAAEALWSGLQWKSFDEIMSFVQDPQDRPTMLRHWRERFASATLQEVSVDLVLLDPASEYGEVHVSYNVLSPPEYVQRRETEIQLWRAGWGRWFVQPITRLSVDGL